MPRWSRFARSPSATSGAPTTTPAISWFWATRPFGWRKRDPFLIAWARPVQPRVPMLKILLVEDQPAVATALQVLFEIRGVDAVVARDPAEALRLLEADASRSIGLVIQDMNFRPEATTGEEGVALFREIRR